MNTGYLTSNNLCRWQIAFIALVLSIFSPLLSANESIENIGKLEDGIRYVSAVEAAKVLELDADIQVLDVRTGFEYGRGHLEDATNVNYYSFSFRKQLNKLDKDVTWLVHCKSGVRSGKTIPIMKELGFTSVIHMDGGINAWRDAELPEV